DRIKGAEVKKFRHQSRSGRTEIPSLRQRLRPLVSMERLSRRDRHGERSIAQLRKAAPVRSRFLELKPRVGYNRRDMRPEPRAARMAKIISKRNDRPAKIEMNRSLPRECSGPAPSIEWRSRQVQTRSWSRYTP